MSNTDSNKGARQNRLRKVLSGMSKHFQAVPSMTIAQVVYPVTDLERASKRTSQHATRPTKPGPRGLRVSGASHESRDVDPLLRRSSSMSS